MELDRPATQSIGPSGPAQAVAAFHGAGNVQVTNANINVAGGDSHTHVHYHSTPKDLRTILDAITNYRKIQQDTLAKATPGTIIWFFDGTEFQLFIDVNGTLKIIWGSGIPGAGKTILASIVIDKLEALAREWNYEICVAYVYIRYSDQGQLTLRSILEVLVKQTVERHPDCFQLAQQTYDRHLREGTQPTEGELLQLLGEFSGMKKATFYVLDALDEAPDRIRLTLLRRLSSLGVRLFITSRPLPAIEAKFPTAHTFPIQARDQDLDLLIAEKIEALEHLQDLLEEGGPDFRGRLVTTVKAKCGGMFLHASLQLDALQQCFTVHDAMQTLEAFPGSIEDVYQQTWERIVRSDPHHASLAKTAFVWVLNAKQSITVDELRHALATSPDIHSFEPSRLMPEAALVSTCRGLITIDKESRLVRLVHYTAKEPLEQLLHPSFPHPYPHSLLASVCMARLKDCGLQNMTMMSRWRLREVLKAEPLLYYAYYAWAFHAHKSLDIDFTASRTLAFIAGCHAFPANPNHFTFDDLPAIDILGPFHTASFYNFPVAFAGPNDAQEINAQSRHYRDTPLHVACKRGHHTAAQSLLCLPEIAVNIRNNSGDTSLRVACRDGQEAIVKLLLAHPDVDINLVDDDGDTPLINACRKGYESILTLLLAHPNIMVNLVNNNGKTALLLAASRETSTSTVKLLLAHPDIDVNCADDSGGTPLMNACRKGNDTIVELIIAHPNIRVNLANSNGDTALLLAASRESNARTVKLLLAHPEIDVNLANAGGDTPLTNACREGFKNIATLLVAAPGVHVNHTNQCGDAAINRAAGNGHEEIVRILLQVPGINASAKSTFDGHTPMSAAVAYGHRAVVRVLQECLNNSAVRREDMLLETSVLVRTQVVDLQRPESVDSQASSVYLDALDSVGEVSDEELEVYEDAFEWL